MYRMKIGRILFDLKILKVEGRRAAPVSPTKHQAPLLEQFRHNRHLKFACLRIGLGIRAMCANHLGTIGKSKK